jgi:hypothetical protein
MALAHSKIVWLKRGFMLLAILFVAFLLYIFSFAPVTRLCGATANTSWNDLPAAVRFIYTPYDALMQPGVLPYAIWRPLNRYDAWWIPGA